MTGYLMIYLHLGLGIPALTLLWFWIISVDGPHVFATISRTYLDSEERRERRKLLLGSLLWFLPGPILLLLGIALGTPITVSMFLTLASLWAYWHVVRQHYGFLTLYQKKNGEPAGKSNPLDYWIFYIMMIVPFVSFLIRHPSARLRLGLMLAPTASEQIVLLLLHGVILIAAGVYVVKELDHLRIGTPLNVPKNLFLLACVPLHLVLFLHPYISTHVDIRLFAVFVTYYHNIQYHGIVWFYNRNRYHVEGAVQRYGLAPLVSRNFATFYLAAFLFTILYRYPEWFLTGALGNMRVGSLFTVADLALVTWWGFAFHHYYLDQKIWRLSRDKRLAQDLKVA